jgi:hypothetical protein
MVATGQQGGSSRRNHPPPRRRPVHPRPTHRRRRLFTVAEARTYLTDKFHDQPEKLIEADELAEDLGRLPLMLGQAAAFMIDRDVTCADYRKRFRGPEASAGGAHPTHWSAAGRLPHPDGRDMVAVGRRG